MKRLLEGQQLQRTVPPTAGRVEPVVHLPGGKSIAVDAKVPFAAYLDAAHATGTRSVLGGPLLDAARRLVDDGLGERDSAVFQQWVADQEHHPQV